jgi:hypothetical protein
MLGSFWDSITGKLAERWAALAGQALVFWAGGFLAWASAHGGVRGLAAPARRLAGYSGPGQAAVLVGALLLTGASAVVMQRISTPVLRLLEGYWPALLRPLRDKMVRGGARRAEVMRDELKQLAKPVADGSASREQRERYVVLDGRLKRMPTTGRLLPTRIGNILRVAETRPVDKYGLDPITLWPHMWLIMPGSARGEISAARDALDSSVTAAVWAVLFIAFSPWNPWAAPVGVVVAAGAVLVWVPARAVAFAVLVEAAFDLYRQDLYARLRWPLPTTPHDERRAGREVTKYLLRGSDATDPVFGTPQPSSPGHQEG